MARVAKPTDVIPGFELAGAKIDIPVDLPEGGHLMVIVGDNPVGVPQISVPIPRGSFVAIIPPQLAEQMRPTINKALADIARQLANGGGPGGIIH